MTEPDNPDEVPDEDDAATDEALRALTASIGIEDDDDEVGEDDVGEDGLFDEDDDDGVGEDGIPDDDAADDTIGDMEDFEGFDEAPIDFTEPGAETDQMFAPVAATTEIRVPAGERRRIDQVEAVAQALALATVERDSGRVRRKVAASATGAAAVGGIPALLQLVGALDLSPELAATAAAAAAAVAAFLSGYTTPERKPTLPPEMVQDLLRS